MPFDYEANVNAVRNALNTQNTTTANPDLSSGLTTRVQTVAVDDPNVIGIRWDMLPAVYVRVADAEEEFAGLGSTGPLTTNVTKFKTVTYELFGLYGKDGASSTHGSVLTEIYRLAENIEGVFQREFTLSGTALYSQAESSAFGSGIGSDGTRVKGVLVTLRAQYNFR